MAKKLYCPNCGDGAYFCYGTATGGEHYVCNRCFYDSATPDTEPPIPPSGVRPVNPDPVQAKREQEEYIATFGYTCCRSKVVGKHAEWCRSDHRGRGYSWGT